MKIENMEKAVKDRWKSNGDGDLSGELLVREQDFPALLEAMRLAYNAGIRDAADGMHEIEGTE